MSLRLVSAFAAGLIFGLGLAVSQMVNPAKVLGFLDIAGDWDPSLLLVMAGAVGVTALAYPVVLRRGRPRFEPAFLVPARAAVDARLIGGSALFGIGWGLVGFCPGPAVAALGFASGEAVIFLVAMLAGMWLHARLPAPASAAPPVR